MIILTIKKQILVSKTGNPYARISLQFNEYRDGKGNLRWASGFGNKLTWAWKVGDDVQPEITDDGKYLNFKFGDEDEQNRLDVYRLPATVGFTLELIKSTLNGNAKPQNTKPQAKVDTVQYPEEEMPDDIPF